MACILLKLFNIHNYTRGEKRTPLPHQYNTQSKTKSMEHKIENLEQQNEDLRREIGQLKEQLNKMFELLTRGAAINAVVAVQGTSIYPLGFTPPFNADNTNVEEYQAVEEYEQAEMNNTGAKPNLGARTRPTLGSGTGTNQGFGIGPTLALVIQTPQAKDK
ncbi:hypothetical protein CR513_06526, partial [Mucuna pruriens]